MTTESLLALPARDVVGHLREGTVTPHDCLDALEAAIAARNGEINALPTLCFERARTFADDLLSRSPGERGVLAGLPIPIKDLTEVAGVRTTFGSLAFSGHIPVDSDLLVERLEAEGAIVYAKSNTPELGAGGNTFNDVFGPTRNPAAPHLSAGGSSGGAAAAIAAGMAWVAHGSDLAGSLRTPAAFCGVTSLRPSPGLIATSPGANAFDVLAQNGPMARDIADLALLADAMSGLDARAPLAKPRQQAGLVEAVRRPALPARIAFSPDLGITETTAEVRDRLETALLAIERAGAIVEPAHPDFAGVHHAFDVLRALGYATGHEATLERHRDVLKPEVVWNIERGLSLTGEDIRHAIAWHGHCFRLAAAFMQDYDLLVVPAAIVTHLPLAERYLGYGHGVPYAEYYRWLAIAYAITMTTLPVVTLPVGPRANGEGFALQLVGRPHGEVELFRHAAAIEQVLATAG